MAGIPYKEFEDTDFMYRMRSGWEKYYFSDIIYINYNLINQST